MPGVRVGRHARIRRAIIDRDVLIPRGAMIGYDPEEDRRRHTVTEGGIVVVTADDEPLVIPIDDELPVVGDFPQPGRELDLRLRRRLCRRRSLRRRRCAWNCNREREERRHEHQAPGCLHRCVLRARAPAHACPARSRGEAPPERSSTLPGFIRLSGSSARLIVRITSSACAVLDSRYFILP